VAPNLDWVPVGAAVGYANTTDAGGYAILGAEAGYNLSDTMTVYVEGRNLTDETYISNFSTTNAANANSALYYPGDGISAFAGVTVRF
ncbi:MAG: TonB-dependent receptor, partial [Alphaproteobacteria bacterium]|nr:TonB-dependent receptor [Alphaproteobacteria bacterium]